MNQNQRGMDALLKKENNIETCDSEKSTTSSPCRQMSIRDLLEQHHEFHCRQANRYHIIQ